MVWWFYRQLKDYKLAQAFKRAAQLRARFDRIFKRRTGYATLDHLLKRLLGRKDELLRVLERPDIPLNTNASENAIRAFVGMFCDMSCERGSDVLRSRARRDGKTSDCQSWASIAALSITDQTSAILSSRNR